MMFTTDTADLFIQTAITILEIGWMVREVVMVNSWIKVEESTRACGNTVNSLADEEKS